MPKRTGLGQRGLDLLIPARPESEEKDSAEKEKTPGKKSASGTAGSDTKKSAGGKAGADTKKSAGEKAGSDAGKSAGQKEGSRTKKPAGGKETARAKKASEAHSSLEQNAADVGAIEEAQAERMSGEPIMISISKVEPNREQPRKNFDEDALQELAESIKQYGIIQPLIVQEKDGYYEIIAGERRWRAARIAGQKEVPVIIRDYAPREVMEISLIENIQREDLNPIEEAGAYRRLMMEFSLKQDEVAQRVSKSRAAIANSVRLLNLDRRVQDMIIAQMLSTGHARALLAITEPEQQYQTAQKVFDEKLTVREVEKLVRKMNETTGTPVKRKISEALQAVYEKLAEQMKSALGTKVTIAARSAQKGKIEIEYYSADELDRLCTLLNRTNQGEGV